MALLFLLRFPAFSQQEQNGPFFAFSWLFQTFYQHCVSRTCERAIARQAPSRRFGLHRRHGRGVGRSGSLGLAADRLNLREVVQRALDDLREHDIMTTMTRPTS